MLPFSVSYRYCIPWKAIKLKGDPKSKDADASTSLAAGLWPLGEMSTLCQGSRETAVDLISDDSHEVEA